MSKLLVFIAIAAHLLVSEGMRLVPGDLKPDIQPVLWAFRAMRAADEAVERFVERSMLEGGNGLEEEGRVAVLWQHGGGGLAAPAPYQLDNGNHQHDVQDGALTRRVFIDLDRFQGDDDDDDESQRLAMGWARRLARAMMAVENFVEDNAARARGVRVPVMPRLMRFPLSPPVDLEVPQVARQRDAYVACWRLAAAAVYAEERIVPDGPLEAEGLDDEDGGDRVWEQVVIPDFMAISEFTRANNRPTFHIRPPPPVISLNIALTRD